MTRDGWKLGQSQKNGVLIIPFPPKTQILSTMHPAINHGLVGDLQPGAREYFELIGELLDFEDMNFSETSAGYMGRAEV